MDTLSQVRRYLECNPTLLAAVPEARSFALDVYYVRQNRKRLATVLCAVITDALQAPFGLGSGPQWLERGGELMQGMLDNFLDAELLTAEEKERGKRAAQGPHTPCSLLLLLAATYTAIRRRRDAKASVRSAAMPMQVQAA
ncbi:hypothetical protein [Hymenobacter guriensis]|uniref:Uncharacterized protein n=1 Tax=Hymenobacter guriensis TaxID=2793065 RepID=A0ABS0L552_9BACT|nr:hypothetical protein [Hymenobacter guriensis]MBG8555060.1 hypothetical protein [Hymenobacter guriensis]